MKKIVLIGNPNVGKSVVFSRLTGAKVIASNYPGTTVDYSKGKLIIDKEKYEIIDAPGTYSLKPSNKCEDVAFKMLEEADIIINVIDATNLERNLFLTLELVEQSKPMIVALNLWDEAQHLGINIDIDKLEEMLGVPVISTVALTGEGIKTLVSKIKKLMPIPIKIQRSDEERWIKIGHIIKNTMTVEHKHHSYKEMLSDLTIKPVTGLPIAFLIVATSFWFVYLIGETIITYLLDPFFNEIYLPLIEQLSEELGTGFLHDILIGQSGQNIDFIESLGVLTTGIYMPLAMVLPYIFAFYLMLSILEDTGYLPRLSTLVDNVFHKLGMHGYGIIPLFLGLGCNVPGALAVRNMETKKQRFIAATLLSIAVPCMAQTAMIFGILGTHGFYYIGLVFISLGIVYVAIGFLLNKIIKGESPEIFLEIPSYRKPSLIALGKKTWMRIRWFLKEALPFLIIGVFVINIFYISGLIDIFGDIASPIMEKIFGIPGEGSVVLAVGFLRKDLAVGMLLSLDLMPVQLVIIATMLTIYFPCVATFAVLIRELGIKDMLKALAVMATTATVVGVFQKLILIGV